MEYPKRLLPSKRFRIIEDISSLFEFYLIRSTETTDNRTNGKLKEECVVRQSDHLRDYSNNLLGIFLIEDINIKVKNKSMLQNWIPTLDPASPTFSDDFVIQKEFGFFLLKISDFHNALIPYIDAHSIKQKVTCKLIHTPTKSNFWHFSLRWFFDDLDLTQLQGQKGKARRIKTAAKSRIIMMAGFNPPLGKEVPNELYFQSTS